MPSVVNDRPRDCYGCRIVGTAGLLGIGAYLANSAWKTQNYPARVISFTLSLAFVTLGVQRYNQQFPFDKKTEKSRN